MHKTKLVGCVATPVCLMHLGYATGGAPHHVLSSPCTVVHDQDQVHVASIGMVRQTESIMHVNHVTINVPIYPMYVPYS